MWSCSPMARRRSPSVLQRLVIGLGATLLGGLAQPATPTPPCPVKGEVIHWIADVCMARLETDDEIAAGDCIDGELKRRPKRHCAAKMHYKRALCGLTKARSDRSAIERCVADAGFMGGTVRNGGVGGAGR
jgi:hypothetical protein